MFGFAVLGGSAGAEVEFMVRTPELRSAAPHRPLGRTSILAGNTEFLAGFAIAVDGGGIKGVIVTRALAILEEHLGQSSHEIFRLAAGTSTGSIISAGIGAGLSGAEVTLRQVK